MKPIRSLFAISFLFALAQVALFPCPAAALVTPNDVGSYGVGVVHLPLGICIQANGDAYVVSADQARVDRFSRYGTLLGSFGSPGTGAGQFGFPWGIASAPNGTVYVNDSGANRVEFFTPAGSYLGQFGTSGAGNGQFNNPRGMAVNAAGEVYVADTYNHRVQKFSATGAYLGQWGGSGSGDGKFNLPYSLAVDSRGRVFVADTYNHRIEEFDGTGTFLRKWGAEGAGDAQFEFPIAIAVDASGNVFVADCNNHRVQRFTSTGVFVSKWGSLGSGNGQLDFPQGLAVDVRGDVHVADTDNHRVQVFRSRDISEHNSILSWGGPGSGNGQFSDVRGVAVSPDGYVYVADKNGDRMQKFTSYGAWVLGWGTSGTGDGQFEGPTGVAVDTSGVVYVTDFHNNRVEKFSPSGSYLGKWGAAGTGTGQFSAIWDIAIDRANNVYVVDANRVQKFTTAGAFVTVWDCTNAAGLGTDGEGFVYVACSGDNVVRKFSSTGTLVREWGGLGNTPGKFFSPADAACDTSGYVYVADANGRVQQFNTLGGYIKEWGSSGSGQDQLGAPTMMATDRAGSVYVGEFLNYRVQKFVSPPELLSIVDVPGDQGGQAVVTFTPSSAEVFQSGAGAVNYRIVRVETNPPIGTVLALIPADGVTRSATVAMGANATSTWTGMRELQVQALLSVPANPPIGTNYGFATDDLPPPPPAPFTGAYTGGATHLHWGASPVSDYSHHELSRSTLGTFPPAVTTYLWAGADTTYTDVGSAGRWYELVAADTCGNLSAPAVLGPDQTISVPGEGSMSGALAFALAPVAPNPAASSSLTLHFTLPDAEPARIELISAAGRSVWSQQVRGAGAHAVRVAGEPAFAPGIYFVRLTRGVQSLVRRAVVLD